MESAQDFIERYLREMRELRQEWRQLVTRVHHRFYSADYEKQVCNSHAEHAKRIETFVSAEASKISATVITSQPFGKSKQQRCRYYLAFSADEWRITNRENECLMCHGLGYNQIDEKPCLICHGKGWNPL